MKHVVELKYTNPSHEHVSLRRRVETVNRVVEAQNANEALNRAANQQRALGFRIQSANIVEQKVEEPKTEIIAEEVAAVEEVEQIDEASLAKLAADHYKHHSSAEYGGEAGYSEKQIQRHREKAGQILSNISKTHGEDIAKAVKKHSAYATEIENASAGYVGKDFHEKFAEKVLGGVGSKEHEKYKSLVSKEGASHHLDEDVELDEAKKPLKPSYWKAEWRLGTQSEVDKNNKKIFDKLAKTDPVKAAAFHDNLMRMKKKDVKEEVEQIDELDQKTLKSYIKKNVDSKAYEKSVNRDAGLERATTKVARSQATSTLKNKVSKLRYTPMNKHKNPYEYQNSRDELANRKVSEEIEQVDEANMRFDPEAAARPKSSDVKNFLNRDKNPRAAAASKKYIRRMTKLGGLGPNQTKKDTEAHMKAHFEEVVTEAEREAGYKMPTHVAAAQKKFDAQSKGQGKMRPQAGTLAAAKMKKEAVDPGSMKVVNKKVKASRAAAKMINAAKGKVNKVDLKPTLDLEKYKD